MTIWRAIGRAGGLTRHAKANQVIVRREVEGERQEFVLDLDAQRTDPNAQPFLLQPGDEIDVPTN